VAPAGSARTEEAKRPQGDAEAHCHGCPCLSCAEDRMAMRERGIHPIPALDWRGRVLRS